MDVVRSEVLVLLEEVVDPRLHPAQAERGDRESEAGTAPDSVGASHMGQAI